MSDLCMEQSVADHLLAMEKFSDESVIRDFPRPGCKLVLPLSSRDRREEFIFDISNGKNIASKVKYQTRARKIIILARLDFKGSPHENPDGERIETPHLHVYREGYGDRIAFPLPFGSFVKCENIEDYLWAFVKYCNIIKLPKLQMRLLE